MREHCLEAVHTAVYQSFETLNEELSLLQNIPIYNTNMIQKIFTFIVVYTRVSPQLIELVLGALSLLDRIFFHMHKKGIRSQ